MSDAIGPSLPPSQPAPAATTNVPVLAKQMQTQVLTMADHLQKILEDPSLSEQPTFLQKMSEDGSHLNQTVEQATQMR
jgi:hypothetical protein